MWPSHTTIALTAQTKLRPRGRGVRPAGVDEAEKTVFMSFNRSALARIRGKTPHTCGVPSHGVGCAVQSQELRQPSGP